MKTITHEELMKELCERMVSHGVSYTITRDVIWNYEQLIEDCLKNVNGTDDLKIKIMDGISIERQYVPEQEMKKGMFKGKTIKEHFNLKATVSKYFKDNLNKWFFDREHRNKEWYEGEGNENNLFHYL